MAACRGRPGVSGACRSALNPSRNGASHAATQGLLVPLHKGGAAVIPVLHRGRSSYLTAPTHASGLQH